MHTTSSRDGGLPADAPAPDAVTRASGAAAERVAADFLVARGLERVDANWRCRVGEIDLVMREPACGTIVFVEVRYRARGGFGGALESVDRGKRARLRRAAFAWLQRHADPDDPARIDVVAMAPAAGEPGDGETGDDDASGSSVGHVERPVVRHGDFLLEWVVDAIGDDGD